ncbi:SDR family oxidoreductase [Cognatishimia sp. SS12]|uniref:SDR family NAD(P)-dependent oxidoreductase n=1 Tax=Cognatishimia sp. SS12 TaxID=2979465 RepID=UPI00232CC177|nr:SDR family oxidoreductase [Cognatishimia sp. SS12]MDC0739615.1 SDR family oxidoreductase [Cognatishimia sp. SS12]
MSQLKDKVVIVTGAGAGIGLGILRQVIAAGATGVGFDVNPAAEAKVTAEGGHFLQVDVADLDALERAIQITRETHGRIDGLVNNAGVTINVPFLEMTRDQMETIWTINHRSILAASQMVSKIMVADGTAGAIVQISSNHSRCSNPGFEAYAGSKGAINAMTRAMGWSLGKHGIRVNALCPGLSKTEIVLDAMQDADNAEMFNSWHADKQVNTVEDVGNLAVFLLSDLSASITGTEIIADRGMSSLLGVRDARIRR